MCVGYRLPGSADLEHTASKVATSAPVPDSPVGAFKVPLAHCDIHWVRPTNTCCTCKPLPLSASHQMQILISKCKIECHISVQLSQRHTSCSQTKRWHLPDETPLCCVMTHLMCMTIEHMCSYVPDGTSLCSVMAQLMCMTILLLVKTCLQRMQHVPGSRQHLDKHCRTILHHALSYAPMQEGTF